MHTLHQSTNQNNMEKMNKKIQMHFEGLVSELKKVGGECIISWHDYEHDKGANAIMVFNPETATALLYELFSRHQYLIPKVLAALAMVTEECGFDDDDDSDDDDDDDDDDDSPDDDPVDVSPVMFEAYLN